MVNRVVAPRDRVSRDGVRAVYERRLVDCAPRGARGGRCGHAHSAAEAVDWLRGVTTA